MKMKPLQIGEWPTDIHNESLPIQEMIEALEKARDEGFKTIAFVADLISLGDSGESYMQCIGELS